MTLRCSLKLMSFGWTKGKMQQLAKYFTKKNPQDYEFRS